MHIIWKDGVHTVYDYWELRTSCPCAGCVDEITGEKLLDEHAQALGGFQRIVFPGRLVERRQRDRSAVAQYRQVVAGQQQAVACRIGEEGQDVMHFAEFGVVMMLFLVGLELQPQLLGAIEPVGRTLEFLLQEMAREAKELNERLSAWIYEISEWKHGDFIMDLDEFFEEPEKKADEKEEEQEGN